MSAPITAAGIIAALSTATDEQKRSIKALLRTQPTPEQAAAAEAFVGKGHVCSVTPSCGRTGFRTAKRAASHDAETGHYAAKPAA